MQEASGRFFFSFLFFQKSAFISNISHAYEQSKWYTKGDKYRSMRNKIKNKKNGNGETKKQAQRNEKRDKCEIRNMFLKIN